MDFLSSVARNKRIEEEAAESFLSALQMTANEELVH